MKYCPISTTFINPASIQNLLTLFLVKAFNSLFISLQLKILICWVVILQRNFRLDFTEDNWLSHQHIRLPWSIVKGFIFFTYVCDCSVKTELIGNTIMWKTVSIVSLIRSKMYRQFAVSFAFELTPGQWSCCTENWTSAFCEFQTTSFPRCGPKFLEDCLLP